MDNSKVSKQCNKCLIEKNLTEFYYRKDRQTHESMCKICKYKIKPKKKKQIYIIPEKQICVKCNIEKEINNFYYRNDTKRYRTKCIDCKLKQAKEYVTENKNETLSRQLNYRQNHRKEAIDYQKVYRENNKDKIKEVNKKYSNSHKEQILEYNRKRYHTNNKYHIRQLLSKRIHSAIKKLKDNEITMKYLDCTIQKFLEWMEFQFYDGMNWDNYGFYWHLDHTLPVSSFHFETEEDIKKCFHWINLRPLRKDKNLIKHNKINIVEYLFQEIKAYKFKKINQIEF